MVIYFYTYIADGLQSHGSSADSPVCSPQPAVTLDVFIKQGVCRPRCTLQYLHTLYLCPVQGAATPLSATPARAGELPIRGDTSAERVCQLPSHPPRSGPARRAALRAGTPVDGSNWPPCQVISADGARQMNSFTGRRGEVRAVHRIGRSGPAGCNLDWTQEKPSSQLTDARTARTVRRTLLQKDPPEGPSSQPNEAHREKKRGSTTR